MHCASGTISGIYELTGGTKVVEIFRTTQSGVWKNVNAQSEARRSQAGMKVGAVAEANLRAWAGDLGLGKATPSSIGSARTIA